jgi:hypothetical protein
VYVERPDGALRFRWVKAPSGTELTRLTQTLARRIGRYLERQGLLERDAENSYLAGDEHQAGPMEQLLGSAITYRIAGGPQQGRKVFTLQTLPACDDPFEEGGWVRRPGSRWPRPPSGPVPGLTLCMRAWWRVQRKATSSNGCAGM